MATRQPYQKKFQSRDQREQTSSQQAPNSVVKQVTVDALVVMKIIKHARENPHEPVRGPLLGLSQLADASKPGEDALLEVTNCFPTPRVSDDDDDSIVQQYQVQMMRWLREVNVDHMNVGWYQAADMGTFFDEDVAAVQFQHQRHMAESVVLIYDPVLTLQGTLSLSAFRLSNKAMELFSTDSFNPKAVREAGLTYRTVFEKVPVTIRASSMARLLIPELSANLDQSEIFDRMDLNATSFMSRNIKLLMEGIDDLSQEAYKFQQYHRNATKAKASLDAQLEARRAENEQLRAKGLPEKSEAELVANHKTPTPPSRLGSLLVTAQINTFCKQVSDFSGQSFGKLYIAKATQPEAEE
ncbi:uncharacterized protein MONBRDRAFT_9558 [Monosiga brevicollis MX1]|uniref:Eukaryotic translation initiation factor 3 subunit H n=1 Tax=Monosiga brevicollis TaxID=81824 RepID=EIF3H_MONBE|nr:uncharacterized protein MONBRDRAFT_9558 [Monosiga brevicollis MX1]A9V3P1.1 RecName: Full=Eukaryotic translation initiation factor 3 subunit H; Short=eIF3h [Monosiga brevicollis]EDQ87737.1 predicted protein [Monosiga brevicollis MX1]|eukprot:XP_001747270.1 hypothetical protein [Monosiga brevicollis MX1]